MPLTIEAMSPNAANWLPAGTALRMINGHLAQEVHVRLWDRTDLAHAWAVGHPGQALPNLPRYAFRAWAEPRTGNVHVLVDNTETPESVTWLLLHELAHHELRASPFVAGALAQTIRHPRYMTDDDAHQADPEERIADWIATRWFRQLGYPPPLRRDRHWWRARVRRVPAGRAGRP